AVTLPVGPGEAGAAGTGGTLTIDVGGLAAGGLPAQAGVAFVTAVDTAGAPLVTRALTGSFTIANLQTGAAWGSVAAARSAVKVEATDPARPSAQSGTSPHRGPIVHGPLALSPPI